MSSKIEASKRMVADTQRLYAALLARPLEDKQLVRPTFKFIQELVRSLITEARILRDVFTPADFDTKRRQWDRHMKSDFVQRLMILSPRNNYPIVGCVASKVIAGLEPNKTLELLQALARIAQSRINNVDEKRPRTFTKQQSDSASSHRSDSSSAKINGAVRHQPAKPAATASKNALDRDENNPIQSEATKTHQDGVKVHHNPRLSQSSTSSLDQERMVTEPRKVLANQTITTKANAVPTSKPIATRMVVETERHNSLQPVATSVFSAFNEDDISSSLHHLRANLKSLRSNLNDICDCEESLLRVANGNR